MQGTRGAQLCFDVESGPGLESKPFTLEIKAADGSAIVLTDPRVLNFRVFNCGA